MIYRVRNQKRKKRVGEIEREKKMKKELWWWDIWL